MPLTFELLSTYPQFLDQVSDFYDVVLNIDKFIVLDFNIHVDTDIYIHLRQS